MEADTNFYIDRTQGFCIMFSVKQGIVQPFDDHEYHGHLSSKTVGKHINELKEICSTKLYKTWIKNWNIGEVYNKTNYNNLEFSIMNLKREIANLDKIILSKWTYESNGDFNNRASEQKLSRTQAKNLLIELEEKFADAKAKVVFAKLQILNEHGIQF